MKKPKLKHEEVTELNTCISKCIPDYVQTRYDIKQTSSDTFWVMNDFTVETLEEKNWFSWQATFGMLGGTLGLMTGTSILSVIDVLIVLVTAFIVKCIQ